MGLIGSFLELTRTTDSDAEVTEVKVDLGGNDLLTAQHYQPSGFDAHPLPDDYILLAPGPEAGSYVIAGYLDGKNANVSRPGDLRLYVRDGNGAVKGELHLTNDGQKPDWQATAGALIARADRVEAALDKLAEDFNGHLHATTGTAGTSPTPGTISPPSTNTAVAPGTETPLEQNTSHSVGADKGWVT